MDTSEVIVAVASPRSPAPRGIVRLAGDDLLPVLARSGLNFAPERSRQPQSIDLGSPLGAISIDLLLWPDARSYVGQPSAELHTLGSGPVLDALVEHFCSGGARMARPGEFTMRAFLAGRLDLSQAEAVLGVIDADTPEDLRVALSQLAGNLSRPLTNVRETGLNLLADVEAGLDFVDEDIEFVSDASLCSQLRAMRDILEQTRSQIRQRDETYDQVRILIRGFPNAGKSQLLNALVNRDAAIVSSIAGTTRDGVVAETRWDDRVIRFEDTAGIEADPDAILAEANRRATDSDRVAAVRLWCVDGADADAMTHAERIQSIAADSKRRGAVDLFLCTKSDATHWRDLPSHSDTPWHAVSAITGQGLSTLRRLILDATDGPGDAPSGIRGTAERCRDSLRRSIDSIDAALAAARNQAGHEIVAAELRVAIECIGEVTGVVYTDDVLDRVFGRFCIGK